MGETIHPERQTVEKCLKDKTYYIDFYQREYVWGTETVKILLDDIFNAFEQSYVLIKDSELTPESLDKYLTWYYLNVFITNTVDSKTFIVDGQQRLSTLTLICVKLYNLTQDDDEKDMLRPCIHGRSWKTLVYRIDHEKRQRAMDYIFQNSKPLGEYKNQTEETIVGRYHDISSYIDNKNLDAKKLTAFIYYVLHKIVLVELSIEKQDDTAMVFEVINDRGEPLKPFEILKGKLIGALNKADTDSYAQKWDTYIQRVKSSDDYKNFEDNFFATYLKAKFIYKENSKKEGLINNSYHRYIFDKNDEADALQFRKYDKNRISSIKNFIDNDMNYYTKLYAKILTNQNNNKFLEYSNNILQLDGQYQLIMSACSIDDPEEDEKINTISKEYERLFMLLQMNNVYESNRFHEILYTIKKEIKDKSPNEYRKVFDKTIIDAIATELNLKVKMVNSVLDYNRFSQLSYCTSRWFYYLLARVEDFICSKLQIQPENDVLTMSVVHSNKKGYHIEHIFSINEENINYFENEDDFMDRRNSIGALLLLKGSDNISSSNEPYKDKLETYSHGPVWARTLSSSFYHKNPNMKKFNSELRSSAGVQFTSFDKKFTPESMEERTKLLFELVKIIWA